MSKRVFRPLYAHNGYNLRPVKVNSDGKELLHCSERKTNIQCGAMGKRELDGSINLLVDHTGHDPDDGRAEAKVAKLEIKKIAQTTQLSPRDIFHEVKSKYGVRPVMQAGTVSSLSRLISRQRDVRCADTDAVDATDPVFQGKMTKDNDGDIFLLFDSICQRTNGRHVAFASPLELDILEKSAIVLSDGTLDVARPPFQQIWCVHAQSDDAIVPVVHVLMSSRGTQDYEFVIGKLKLLLPTWNPRDYLGDLELGQSKAFKSCFPAVKLGFCYFHLTQAWKRKLKQLQIDDCLQKGMPLSEFWSLLKCLPFGDPTAVLQDFDEIWNLIPQPITTNMNKFREYMVKYYIGNHQNIMFPPITWNVVSRTVRDLPRTTNSVEATHRNIERCIQNARGRSAPLLSELLKCLRQEASKRKFDKEALFLNPSYKVSSQRKLKDELKDRRILKALQNTQGIQGVPFLKAIRAARQYI